VHTLALQLAPVLAAEKSKVPFYIAGGLLVSWALILSLGLGMRRPEFPGGESGQRIVMAISALLVLGAVSTAVITSGPASKASAAGSSAPQAGGAALAANSEGQLAYDTKELSAKAGKVTITMTNMASLAHDVAIEQGGRTLGSIPAFSGGSRTLALDLKPGTYTFFCTVPGHRTAGMEGTLKVS
jgi:plastocyanin